MSIERRRFHWVFQMAVAASVAICFVLTALWLLGYFYYSSVGIDVEGLEGGEVVYTYCRVRWPGDGSVWVGFERARYRYAGQALDAFDLAGTFFQEPRRPSPLSMWNRLGFWFVGEAPAKQRLEGGFRVERAVWVGLPNALVVAATALLPCALVISRYRRRTA